MGASGAKKNAEHEAEPPEWLKLATASGRSSTASSYRATGVDKTETSDNLQSKRSEGVVSAETQNRAQQRLREREERQALEAITSRSQSTAISAVANVTSSAAQKRTSQAASGRQNAPQSML